MKSAVALFKQTLTKWIDDNAPRLGAALAFYSMLSIGPLLLVILAVAGLFFDAEVAQGKVLTQLDGIIGVKGASALQDMLKDAAVEEDQGWAAAAIGLFTLLLGASGVFGQLHDAMNTIWGVELKPGRGLRGFIAERFFSAVMVLGTAFLLLTSLVISAGLSALGDVATGRFEDFVWAMQAVNFLVSFGAIAFLFALIFKYVPDAKVAWADVVIGAVMTSLLFAVGKYAIGFYLGRGSFASAYGAAGSLVVVLVWVFYSAQILFFGAEFTQVYAARRGRAIEPAKNARLVAGASDDG